MLLSHFATWVLYYDQLSGLFIVVDIEMFSTQGDTEALFQHVLRKKTEISCGEMIAF